MAMPTPAQLKPSPRFVAARQKLQSGRNAANPAAAAPGMYTEAEAVKAIQLATKAVGYKHDPTGTPIGNYYGSGGLFSNTLGRPDMFSAVMQPMSWWAGLPMRESLIENAEREILTAVTAASGENPSSVCGNPPTPGVLQTCRVYLPFGQYFAGSPVLDTTKIGMLDAYGVQPRQLINFAETPAWFVPDPLRLPNVDLSSEVAIQLYILATTLARQAATVELDGNPATAYTATDLGWIREPTGLSRLIKTGWTDISGAACNALDSIVVDWDAAVDAASSASYSGGDLPRLLNDIHSSLMSIARGVGMPDTRWQVVMPEPLFAQLVFKMACSYALARCADGAVGTPIGRTMTEIEARYNEMRGGNYLLLNGMQVPVGFTSGYEMDTSVAPVTGASIFFVPMTGAGRDLTFLEYFPLDNPAVQAWNRLSNTTDRFYTNNGMYGFASRSSGFCDQLLVTHRPRLVLETPFLAARVDNITFNLTVGWRSPFPGNSSYYNGGTSSFSNVFS